MESNKSCFIYTTGTIKENTQKLVQSPDITAKPSLDGITLETIGFKGNLS